MSSRDCRFRARVLLAVAILLVGEFSTHGWADRPNKSAEILKNEAHIVVTGLVKRIYSDAEKSQAWVDTTYVVEVAVGASEKGSFRKGDLLYPRYSTRKFTGSGNAAPGYYGLHTEPEKGQTVRIYLTRAEDGGLDVIDPNGVEILKSP